MTASSKQSLWPLLLAIAALVVALTYPTSKYFWGDDEDATPSRTAADAGVRRPPPSADAGVRRPLPDAEYVRETLAYSDYVVTAEYRSLIDPKNTVFEDIGFTCPKCKKILDPLEHGNRVTCTCGLEMVVWGNALECVLSVEQLK
jgi:hypothetical protein